MPAITTGGKTYEAPPGHILEGSPSGVRVDGVPYDQWVTAGRPAPPPGTVGRVIGFTTRPYIRQ